MGIQGLSRLVADVAPEAIKEVELASFFGRRIAIDASMSLYQFLVAIRYSNHVLTNEAGEATSHIIGFFYRTCKLLEAGIKPIYVFDGKPPQLKSGELEKRKERREEAAKKLEAATTAAEAQKFEKRLVRVTKSHNDDVKKLLRLMGLPVIEAPSEAEAQCAQMCKEGLVYGVATEDMDALTFGASKVIRNLSSGSGEKVKEYDLSKVLEGLGLTHGQFIDLSILMGCDYCDTIKGIGPKKGLDLIKKYRTIEDILKEKFNITNFVENVEVTYKTERANRDEADLIQESKDSVKVESKKFSGIKDAIKAKVNEEVSKWDENGEGEIEFKIPNLSDEIKDEDLSDEIKLDDEDEVKIEDEEEVVEDVKDEDEDDKETKSRGKIKKGKTKVKAKGEKKSESGVPENWLFKGARKLFVEPNVLKNTITEGELKIKDVDEDGLINFLVQDQGFSEDRVRAALKRIENFKKKSSQSRIDSFFKVIPKDSPKKKQPEPAKRSNEKGKGSASTAKRVRRGR